MNQVIIDGIEDRFDSSSTPNLMERIRTCRSDFITFELSPAVRSKYDVTILTRTGELDVLSYDHVYVVIRVEYQLIEPLSIIDNVNINKPTQLGWGRHMRTSCEYLSAIAWGINNQRFITMRPVADFLTLQITFNVLPVNILGRIENGVERIFSNHSCKTRSRPMRALVVTSLVVTSPCMRARTLRTDITCQHQRYIRRTVMHRCVEVMVDSFTIMDFNRLDGTNVASHADN